MDSVQDVGLGAGYRECDGLKGGKLYTTGDGYFYSKNYLKPYRSGVVYLCCKTRSCRGSAKLSEGVLSTISVHSVGCQPDKLFEETVKLRKRILHRCGRETTSLQKIFNEECNKEVPEIAATINYPSLVSTMKRERRKRVPPIPQSYMEYEQLLGGRLEDADGVKYLYKKVGEGVNECMIFIVSPIESLLSKSKEIHLDGTFKIVPNTPASRQMLSILAMEQDHAFPVVMALMKSKSTNSYIEVFNFLKEKYPGMQPSLIISDYEQSIKAAVKRVFPNSTHKGCWFHYSQSIFRQVQRQGLLNAYYDDCEVKNTIRMLMALALLPERNIVSAFNDIKTYDDAENIREIVNPIFTYFETQWIQTVGSGSFSVYGQPRRTNNSQESFHHMLFNSIGKAHPNIWEFTEYLKRIGKYITGSFGTLKKT